MLGRRLQQRNQERRLQREVAAKSPVKLAHMIVQEEIQEWKERLQRTREETWMKRTHYQQQEQALQQQLLQVQSQLQHRRSTILTTTSLIPYTRELRETSHLRIPAALLTQQAKLCLHVHCLCVHEELLLLVKEHEWDIIAWMEDVTKQLRWLTTHQMIAFQTKLQDQVNMMKQLVGYVSIPLETLEILEMDFNHDHDDSYHDHGDSGNNDDQDDEIFKTMKDDSITDITPTSKEIKQLKPYQAPTTLKEKNNNNNSTSESFTQFLQSYQQRKEHQQKADQLRLAQFRARDSHQPKRSSLAKQEQGHNSSTASTTNRYRFGIGGGGEGEGIGGGATSAAVSLSSSSFRKNPYARPREVVVRKVRGIAKHLFATSTATTASTTDTNSQHKQTMDDGSAHLDDNSSTSWNSSSIHTTNSYHCNHETNTTTSTLTDADDVAVAVAVAADTIANMHNSDSALMTNKNNNHNHNNTTITTRSTMGLMKSRIKPRKWVQAVKKRSSLILNTTTTTNNNNNNNNNAKAQPQQDDNIVMVLPSSSAPSSPHEEEEEEEDLAKEKDKEQPVLPNSSTLNHETAIQSAMALTEGLDESESNHSFYDVDDDDDDDAQQQHNDDDDDDVYEKTNQQKQYKSTKKNKGNNNNHLVHQSPFKMQNSIMVVLLFISVFCCTTTMTHAAPWFGGGYTTSITSTDGEQPQQEKRSLVSPILNRELETTVVAHSWPSNPQSVLCEAYAFYQATYSNDGARQNLTSREQEEAVQVNAGFLNALSRQILLESSSFSPLLTSQQARNLVLRAVQEQQETPTTTTTSSTSTTTLLLSFVLAMRAHSPQCELHRGLARQTLQQKRALTTFGTAHSGEQQLFAVVYPGGILLKQHDLLQDDESLDLTSLFIPAHQQNDVVTNTENDEIKELLLPGEIPFGSVKNHNMVVNSANKTTSTKLMILYANLGTSEFAKVYQRVRDTTMTNIDFQFVVRHLGAVHYEEELHVVGSSSPTVLQGYGVRLDIRNAEYKVFDDRKTDVTSCSNEEDLRFLNLTALELENALKVPNHHFVAGVNITALGIEDNNTSLKELWQQHEAQQANLIPPTWQRRKLSLQAASVIAASKDPLMTLEEVACNLPSVGSTLVHHKIPDKIQEVVEKTEDAMDSFFPSGTGALLINGRKVSIDRSTFNIFELINLLRKEQGALDRLQTELGPYLSPFPGTLKKVKNAWTMGESFLTSALTEMDEYGSMVEPEPASKSFRIDVARGWKQAVMYLNDVEKDTKYARWPRSVRQMFMAVQYGMTPSVRRNFFNILTVLNPLASTQNVGMTLAKQLMQSSYPARLGVLIVDDEDVKACADWVAAHSSSEAGEACPVAEGPVLQEVVTVAEKDKLKEIPGTTRALHALFANLLSTHTNDEADAYLDFVMALIDQEKAVSEDGLSMYAILDMHVKTMNMAQMGTTDKLWKNALELLSESETDDEDDSKKLLYNKALRFAVDKGLTSTMSFINGRPLPIGDPEDVLEKAGKILNEEMNEVLMKIQGGDITDSSPKSIYAMFLTGKGVFKKVHPLLMDSRDKSESYVRAPHDFGAESLLFPSASQDVSPEAVFVIEAFLDIGSLEGLEIAKSFITVMTSFPATIAGGGEDSVPVKIGYRIIPSKVTDAAKTWCPLLANAAEIGADGLAKVLDAAVNKADGANVSLDALPELSDRLKQKMQADLANGACSKLPELTDSPGDNLLVSNGLYYALEGSTITKDDVELLLSLDLDKSKAVTSYLKDHVSSDDPVGCEAMFRCIAFLALEAASSTVDRVGLDKEILDLEKKLEVDDNPMRFSWNQDNSDQLQLSVAAFVNPTTEMAQRLAPVLRVLRDSLGLPLSMVLTPKAVLDADEKIPITSFYRFVADPTALQDLSPPKAVFRNLPLEHTFTVRMDVPEPWDIQQSAVVQDTDNLRCDVSLGCSDEAHTGSVDQSVPIQDREHVTRIEYGLNHLLIFGQCYETTGSPPNGLQLQLTRRTDLHLSSSEPNNEIEVGMDGTVLMDLYHNMIVSDDYTTDTLVMKTVGYWQLRANPGVWNVQIEKSSKGAEIFNIIDGIVRRGRIKVLGELPDNSTKQVVMKDFVNRGELLLVKRNKGFEKAKLFSSAVEKSSENNDDDDEEVIHVFSLATGHLYERFLKIMMLSVTRRTSTNVKFWLFENFLSPSFKDSARYMADQIGCEVEFVTYKWPEWLRGQSEKQRIIWGYKILFLDVLFPLSVKKIIYVDADQVIRGDLKELWDMDLEGAPYGYTPMCSSRESTLGFQFWKGGFWETHLRGRPYHISALYVVDLQKFRKDLVGDQLRSIYQQLSADPNSLANLDQDLPNYAQHAVPIFSLPQEWLWCESWCSDETKATAKTIDLCNNPLHKEAKVSMARRIISGPLFEESWEELDETQEKYRQEWLETLSNQ